MAFLSSEENTAATEHPKKKHSWIYRWFRRVIAATLVFVLLSVMYNMFQPKDLPTSVHMGMGTLFLVGRRPAAAADAFENAVYKNSSNMMAYALLSTAYADAQRLREAEKAGKSALALAPENPIAHMVLCRAFMMSDQWLEGINQMERAIRSSLETVALQNTYGTVRFLTTPLKNYILNDCERACRRSVELRPNDAGAHAALGWIMVAKKKDEEALRQYRILKQLDEAQAKTLLTAIGPQVTQKKADKLLSVLDAKKEPKKTSGGN